MAEAFEPPGFAHGDLVAVQMPDGTLRTEVVGRAVNPDDLERLRGIVGQAGVVIDGLLKVEPGDE